MIHVTTPPRLGRSQAGKVWKPRRCRKSPRKPRAPAWKTTPTSAAAPAATGASKYPRQVGTSDLRKIERRTTVEGDLHDQGAKHRRVQDAAKQAAIEILDDLLQHEGDAGQGSIKGRGEAGGGPRGGGHATAVLRHAHASRELGRRAAGELHRRAFPPEAGTAAHRQEAGDEFHPNDLHRHVAEVLPKCEFELRDAAARRLGAETGEQETSHQGSRDDHQERPDEKASRRQLRELQERLSKKKIDANLEDHGRQTAAQSIERRLEDGTGLARNFLEGGGERLEHDPQTYSSKSRERMQIEAPWPLQEAVNPQKEITNSHTSRPGAAIFFGVMKQLATSSTPLYLGKSKGDKQTSYL